MKTFVLITSTGWLAKIGADNYKINTVLIDVNAYVYCSDVRYAKWQIALTLDTHTLLNNIVNATEVNEEQLAYIERQMGKEIAPGKFTVLRNIPGHNLNSNGEEVRLYYISYEMRSSKRKTRKKK